jgi:hypothetical protein
LASFRFLPEARPGALASGQFRLPVDDHLIAIHIHLIQDLTQLNIIKFALPPILSFFFKGLKTQQIIQDSPDFLESEVIIGDDVEN